MSEQRHFHKVFCHRLAGAAAISSISLLLIFSGGTRAAEVREFIMGNTVTALSAAPPEVQVLYSAMRFNETTEEWNVDVIVTNGSPQTFTGQIVFSVEGFMGTTGPLRPDGFSLTAPGNPFYRLALVNPEQHPFAPGGVTPRRTIALGYIEGAPAPRVTSKVFVRPLVTSYALALTRTLDELGQPLTGVRITESSPLGARTLFSDSEYGVVTLGQEAAAHLWRFEHPGHLPVWRRSTLAANTVRLIPNPRLTRQNPDVQLFTSAGGSAQDSASNIVITAAAGAFAGDSEARLTPIDGQTLPGLLPQGWSPLSGFWLKLSREPVGPLAGRLRPASSIAPTDTAALVRWNETQAAWFTIGPIAGAGTNAVVVQLSSSGAYAVVVADTGLPALVPPLPTVGQLLLGSVGSMPVAPNLTASGTVNPGTAAASLLSEDVTALATVQVMSSQAATPSGLILRCDVREDYKLQDGSRRFTPPYENFFVGYQLPGDLISRTVHGTFPLRPVVLFGSDELAEARITVDVLPSGQFTGGVFDTNGTTLEFEGIRLVGGSGTFIGPQAAMVRRLATTNFTDLLTKGLSIEAAFDLTVAATAPGRRISLQLSNGPARHFVLARVLSNRQVAGLEPVERMASDTNGTVSGIEPGTGEHLPGLTKAGQYVLVNVGGPQAVVRGIVRGETGQFLAGAPVRATGQPWMTLSASNGAYQLVAPTGVVQIATIDPGSNNADFVDITITDASAPAHIDLSSVERGPRVIGLSPGDGAQQVERVSPVVLNFSKPVNPGTVVAGGVRLLNASNQAVTASVSLNLRNTGLTLLPSEPLAFGARYTIQLSSNITDLTGRKLEGSTQFSFRTVPVPTGPELAKLTIYEPGATTIPSTILEQLVGYDPVANRNSIVAAGSPGSAEPGRPVILINESSGETSTVLSKPDGRFFGVVHGGQEDFVSATVVNLNGTRNYIPVSRQEFDNGFVGLYRAGGILEARNVDQRVEVFVEPGAISEKTTFRISAFTAAQAQQILKELQPVDGGKILNGFSFEAEGDQLNVAAHVRVSVDSSTLNVPPGENPSNGVYALVTDRVANGVKVFEVVDALEFRDGFLETQSPPFRGLGGDPLHYLRSRPAANDMEFQAAAAGFGGFTQNSTVSFYTLLVGFGGRVQIDGKFFSKPPGLDVANLGVDGGRRPVPGGVVIAAPQGLAASAPRVGEAVGIADAHGSFAMLARLASGNDSIRLLGFSPLFPGKIGTGFAQPPTGSDVNAIGHVLIESGNGTPQSANDRTPPTLSISHSPQPARVGEPTAVRVFATDNASQPQIDLSVGGVTPLGSTPVSPADIILAGIVVTPTANTARKNYGMIAPAPARVELDATAVDQSGNSNATKYVVLVGRADPLLPAANADPEDTAGPILLWSYPFNGIQDFDRFHPIHLRFSEPLNPDVIGDIANAVALLPPAGVPQAKLGDNGRRLEIQFPTMAEGVDYTLTLNSNIRDLANNPYDFDPRTPAPDSFSFGFKTEVLTRVDLSSLGSGSGVAANATHLFAITRSLDRLIIISRNSTSPLANVPLPAFPRDIVYLGRFAYRRPNLSVVEKELVAVTGGLVGLEVAESERAWLLIFDVTDPANPAFVARTSLNPSPVAAIPKLAWSRPILGFLAAEGDVTSIGLIDLQLFLYAKDPDFLPDSDGTSGGFPGTDANGDGDYADDGDAIPLPDRDRPVFGINNGGLVQAYAFSPDPETTSPRIADFDLALQGNFVALVLNHPVSGSGEFKIVAISRTPLESDVSLSIGGSAERLLLLFNQAVEIGDHTEFRNLALVSRSGSLPGLLVVDITNPLQPVAPLPAIRMPDGAGIPKTAMLGRDGLIYLACSRDIVILDPRLFLVPPAGPIHPSVRGVLSGVGAGARSFVAGPPDAVVVNHGSRFAALLGAGAPAISLDSIRAIDLNLTANALDPDVLTTRLSENDLLEIVQNLEGEVSFFALYNPLSADLSGESPIRWTSDFGLATNAGPAMDLAIPGWGFFSQTIIPPVLPGILFDLLAEEHRVEARLGSGGPTKAVTVRVYPSIERAIKAKQALVPTEAQINAAIKLALERVRLGPFKGVVQVTLPTGAISGTAQWKECPTNNLASWTLRMTGAVDPFFGLKSGIALEIDPKKVMPGPSESILQTIGATNELKASLGLFFNGQLSFLGSFERDGCGNVTGRFGGSQPGALAGKIALSVQLEIKLGPILGVNAAVETSVTTTGTPAFLTYTEVAIKDFSARWDGVQAAVSVRLLDGALEFTDKWQLADSATIIPRQDLPIPWFEDPVANP